jgi:D5 N terminal like
MAEIVRTPLDAQTIVQQIQTDIETYLCGGPNREAEDVELGQRYGLNVERIKAQWAEARRAFFIWPDAQPEIEVELEPPPTMQAPKPMVAPVVDMGAPFEVARRFLVDRYRVDRVATLRWWQGEWRKWNRTHYAVMEEDELRAELYLFLAKVNQGKFDPAQKHVNAVIDAIKAWVFLSAEVEIGAWLGSDEPPWGDGAIICCKNGVLRLSDGRMWPHDPKLFALNVIETEYRSESVAPRWEQFLDELWADDVETRNTLQEFFGLALTDETRFQKASFSSDLRGAGKAQSPEC